MANRKLVKELDGFKIGDRVVMTRVQHTIYRGETGVITELDATRRTVLVVPDSAADVLTEKGDGFYTALDRVDHTPLSREAALIGGFGNVC